VSKVFVSEGERSIGNEHGIFVLENVGINLSIEEPDGSHNMGEHLVNQILRLGPFVITPGK